MTADDGPMARDADDSRYPRLQGRLQEQVAFVNNLLVTLAVAILAFAVGASADPSKLPGLGWRRWLFAFGLLLLAASLLTGVGLAVNRLQSFRITAQIARIRDLRDRQNDGGSWARSRLRDRSEFLARWSTFRLGKNSARRQVEEPARSLHKLLGNDVPQSPGNANDSAGAANDLLTRLRAWNAKAGLTTWRLLWWQCATFVLAAMVLLIVPLSYYL